MRPRVGAKNFLILGAFCICSQGPIRGQEDILEILPAPKQIELTVERGYPLRVILTKKLLLNHENEPVSGKLLDPIYAYDREVVAAGSDLEGRISHLRPVARRERIQALMKGDFTPLRQADIEFDTLVSADGKRIPLHTVVVPGADKVARVADPNAPKKSLKSRLMGTARDKIDEQKKSVLETVKGPGKLERLEAAAVVRLPYHPQFLPVGTRLNAELRDPLSFGIVSINPEDLEQLGSQPPADSIAQVRLVTPLYSATTRNGAEVEAALTAPLYSSDHHLIFPEGSRMLGKVVEVEPARMLRRSGRMRFLFDQIQLPGGDLQPVKGYLDSVEVDHDEELNLDSESGTTVATSKKRFAGPAISILLAATPLNIGGRIQGFKSLGRLGNTARRGFGAGMGFGLVGGTIAQFSDSFALGFGYYGVAWSVYRNLLARGKEVNLPADTPMEIRFSPR